REAPFAQAALVRRNGVPVTEASKPPERKLPLAQDLQRLLPSIEITMIFDVGANVGQTVRSLAAAYPYNFVSKM
ncbi:MAG: hypothetical protein PHQ03_01445, partial [Methylococcales bacterium]|nr:hypothetical protein [Methylococcales bacterium]